MSTKLPNLAVIVAVIIFFVSGCGTQSYGETTKIQTEQTEIKKMSSATVKFGQVYRAIRDVKTDGVVNYRAPVSSGFHCSLPKGTKIVIENDPPAGAKGVWALPINYKELESKLVPEEARKSQKYNTYCIGILLEYLDRHFVKEDIEEIRFDDESIQKHWEAVAEMHKKQSAE